MLSPEIALFVQSRLFDPDFKKMVATARDNDANLPENLPDIEAIIVSAKKDSSSLGRLIILQG